MLRTLGAPQRRLLGRRRPKAVEGGEPEPVPTSRATIVRAKPFESAGEADAWLEATLDDSDEAVAAATRELNFVLRSHRASAVDPYARDVRAEHALVVRLGYGDGDQVADGRFGRAVELPKEPRKRKRGEAPRAAGAARGHPRRPRLAAGWRGAPAARPDRPRHRAPARGGTAGTGRARGAPGRARRQVRCAAATAARTGGGGGERSTRRRPVDGRRGRRRGRRQPDGRRGQAQRHRQGPASAPALLDQTGGRAYARMYRDRPLSQAPCRLRGSGRAPRDRPAGRGARRRP